jgi:hypothetical protein
VHLVTAVPCNHACNDQLASASHAVEPENVLQATLVASTIGGVAAAATAASPAAAAMDPPHDIVKDMRACTRQALRLALPAVVVECSTHSI